MNDPTHVNSLLAEPDPTRDGRMAWFRDARLGMFVHLLPCAALAHGDWAMQQEGIPAAEFDALIDRFKPEPGWADRLAELAVTAGMRYAVLTSKHCDGFQMFPSRVSRRNAAHRGPRRDLVREWVDACRARGLRVGLYYGLMDWNHPDGDRCAVDEAARQRFVAATHSDVLQLMEDYGTIDMLWFDGPWPLATPELWESRRLIAEVRRRQPGIIINNRARTAEDFSTPEGSVNPAPPGRDWEACMTLNGTWGNADPPDGDWESARDVLRMLRLACAGAGNLLLNVNMRPDGSPHPRCAALLRQVGTWLQTHGEAVYGATTRVNGRLESWLNTGFWSMRGTVGYFWLLRTWPGPRFGLARVRTPVRRISWLHDGSPLDFTQDADRLLITGAPLQDPDPTTCRILRVEFAGEPQQQLGAGMIDLPPGSASWW